MLWPGGVFWGVGWNMGGLPGVYGVPDSIFVKIIDPREGECPWLLGNKPLSLLPTDTLGRDGSLDASPQGAAERVLA